MKNKQIELENYLRKALNTPPPEPEKKTPEQAAAAKETHHIEPGTLK